MKKRVTTLLLAFILGFSQMLAGGQVKAESSNFSVEVIVNSYDKVIASGTSAKNNALQAVDEILKESNIFYEVSAASWGGKYISEIQGVKEKHFGGYDGWLYAVQRGNQYVDIATGIDEFELQNGDRLIVYYGDFTTLTVNKLDFSTKNSGENLQITLNNTYTDWQTNKTVTQPVKGLHKVIIDGKEINVVDNRIHIPTGLAWGKHILEIKDFASDRLPLAVADKIEFEFYPSAYIRIEGMNDTIVEGKQKGENLLQMVEALLKEKGIEYKLKTDSMGKRLTSVQGLEEGTFGGYDGWLYFIKNKQGIVEPSFGMEKYIPNDDNIVVYYSDFNVPYVNIIKSTPETIKENEPFRLQFIYKNAYDNTNRFITNAIVNIDGINHITDLNGQINVKTGLAKGTHSYKISGYNGNKLSTVVMDKGIFIIDGNSPLSFDYASDRVYEEKDNNKITKDIDAQISALKNFISSSDDPWSSLVLQKLGIRGGESYIKQMAGNILEEGLSACTTTDLEKLIFNLTALEYNPYDFMGKDLVAEVFNRNEETLLLNDAIFGLLLYNYANISGQYNLTEEKLINLILNQKLNYDQNGKHFEGWALSGDKLNPDITGAALSALAPYSDDNHPQVKAAVAKVVDSLSMLQNESGYLADNLGSFSESLSFVIIGLTAVGENPEGYKFTKSKGDLVSALISFKGTNGQYKHSLEGDNDYMASEQALRALFSLKQYKITGKYDFYNNSVDMNNLKVYTNIAKTGFVVDNTVLIAAVLILTLIITGFFFFRRKRANG